MTYWVISINQNGEPCVDSTIDHDRTLACVRPGQLAASGGNIRFAATFDEECRMLSGASNLPQNSIITFDDLAQAAWEFARANVHVGALSG